MLNRFKSFKSEYIVIIKNKVNQMAILTDLMSVRKKTKFLNNSVSYFKLLKESEEKEISSYKLEIAKILNDFDMFFLKLRMILSIIGMVVSVLLIGIIADRFFRYGIFESNSYIIIHVMYLYFSIFIMMMSYRTFKRTLLELNILAEFIKE